MLKALLLSIALIPADAREVKGPHDILPCVEDERPGHDCNCIGWDEDVCTVIPWQSCSTDLDCVMKFGPMDGEDI